MGSMCRSLARRGDSNLNLRKLACLSNENPREATECHSARAPSDAPAQFAQPNSASRRPPEEVFFLSAAAEPDKSARHAKSSVPKLPNDAIVETSTPRKAARPKLRQSLRPPPSSSPQIHTDERGLPPRRPRQDRDRPSGTIRRDWTEKSRERGRTRHPR